MIGEVARRSSAPPTVVRGSVFEREGYLRPSAAHVGADLEVVEGGGACLPLLRMPNRTRRTVYGLPRPYGDDRPDALIGLADAMVGIGAQVEVVLSPLGSGPELARALGERGGEITGTRQMCLVDTSDADPFDHIARRSRRAIATALRRGARAELGALTDGFGPNYRAAMRALDAAPIYLFSEDYFVAMAALDHYVVNVTDADGVAAAALFLRDEHEAYYHLGWRRSRPQAPVGAMNLALAEGIREAWRTGAAVTVLGGGRTDADDDPLFGFKRQLATHCGPRFSVQLPDRSSW